MCQLTNAKRGYILGKESNKKLHFLEFTLLGHGCSWINGIGILHGNMMLHKHVMLLRPNRVILINHSSDT